MSITLYHHELGEKVEVPNERSANVLKKTGWTEDPPDSASYVDPLHDSTFQEPPSEGSN